MTKEQPTLTLSDLGKVLLSWQKLYGDLPVYLVVNGTRHPCPEAWTMLRAEEPTSAWGKT